MKPAIVIFAVSLHRTRSWRRLCGSSTLWPCRGWVHLHLTRLITSQHSPNSRYSPEFFQRGCLWDLKGQNVRVSLWGHVDISNIKTNISGWWGGVMHDEGIDDDVTLESQLHWRAFDDKGRHWCRSSGNTHVIPTAKFIRHVLTLWFSFRRAS